jgi:G protein beta subunit-like protein
VNRLVISPDRRFLAVAGFANVRLYDLKTTNPNPITAFDGHTANVTGIAINQDATWMATSSEDGTLKVWDIRAPGLQRNYDHRAPVNDVCAHPNQGEIVSCDQSGSIKIWDLGENTCSHDLIPEEGSAIRSVGVSSDCTTLVAGNHRGKVFVWRMPGATDFGDLQPAHRFQAHNRYITRVALSHDQISNRLNLATCSADATVKIWDLTATDNQLKKTLVGHQRWVWDCAFSADSAYLVTASSDHTSRLWDLATGETIRQYIGHQKATTCVALNDISV